jgi:hypothetical protein
VVGADFSLLFIQTGHQLNDFGLAILLFGRRGVITVDGFLVNVQVFKVVGGSHSLVVGDVDGGVVL